MCVTERESVCGRERERERENEREREITTTLSHQPQISLDPIQSPIFFSTSDLDFVATVPFTDFPTSKARNEKKIEF